jgi:hypothetical protein
VHGVLGAYASDGVEGDNWGIRPILKGHLGALVPGCFIEQVVSKLKIEQVLALGGGGGGGGAHTHGAVVIQPLATALDHLSRCEVIELAWGSRQHRYWMRCGQHKCDHAHTSYAQRNR